MATTIIKCPNCDTEIEFDNSKDHVFCTNCGSKVFRTNVVKDIDVDTEKQEIIAEALEKVNTSRTVWLIVSALQVLIGIPLICEIYGVLPIILGVINFIKAYELKEKLKEYRARPYLMIEHYEPIGGLLVLFFILNLLLGAVVGCIGVGYEMKVRKYVKNHKEDLK